MAVVSGGAAVEVFVGRSERVGKPVAGTVGEPAIEVDLEFTVHGMTCGVQSLGSADSPHLARGTFCLLDVTMKNIGDDIEHFEEFWHQAYDARGNEYDTDKFATDAANEDSPTFQQRLDPGEQTRGKLVFDVPPRTTLTSVVLHGGGPQTPGVKVPLP